MANLKTYLNVPYAEKETAKALGAKWDPVIKKWYVPEDKDIIHFAGWQIEPVDSNSSASAPKTKSRPVSAKPNPSSGHAVRGAITQPADINFVAYDGDEPPWD